MKKILYSSLTIALLGTAAWGITQQRITGIALANDVTLVKRLQGATPFQNNNGVVPVGYSGPSFVLNHAWPSSASPPIIDAPWRKAIGNGRITVANAAAYASALKAAVAANGRKLVADHSNWDASKAGWYNEPWLGTLREPISGTYQAGEFGPGIFPGTGLEATFQTNVLTYYDARAAATLTKFWHRDAMQPVLATTAAQFDEGAIIVKAALFSSEDSKRQSGWWKALDGAATWPLYISVGPQDSPTPPPAQLWSGSVAQFDIIVKDSASSPDTGWVFMTLVYDAKAPGDVWDKMVPLGVQWGNDPQATVAGMALKENWINPSAPLYSKQTLGWGGRLSGPNDGGRNNISVDGKEQINAPDSSCMSCHSTSQWDPKTHRMTSFLLPSIQTNSPPYFKQCGPNQDLICSPAPGSTAWMKWFKNRPGTMAMDPGSFATDFDEVFAFKSLKLWWFAVGPKDQALPLLRVQNTPGLGVRFNQYSGAPIQTNREAN